MDAAKAVTRGKFSDTSLCQETRKISNKQPNFTPKETRKLARKIKLGKTRSLEKDFGSFKTQS